MILVLKVKRISLLFPFRAKDTKISKEKASLQWSFLMLTLSSSSSETLPWLIPSLYTLLLLEVSAGGVAAASSRFWDSCDIWDICESDGSEEPVDDPDMVLLRFLAGRAPVSGSLVHTRFCLNSAYTWYV